ncbi:MAG: hypothetical protein SXV54_14620 [Chloroflexota bacterium]|nr:hypothetical protein [Chloroflexota bacterium]
MTDRSQELEIRLRQNHGRRLLPEFLDDLSKSLKRPKEDILLLDVEKTFELLESYKALPPIGSGDDEFVFEKVWAVDQVEQAKRFISNLKDRMPHRQMFLFRRLSEYCGAVIIDLDDLLQNAFQLIGLDQEHIVARSDDGTFSIIFDHYENRTEVGTTEEVFYIRLWGREWLLAMGDLLRE